MALYFQDKKEFHLATTLSFWQVETAIIDLFSLSLSKNSKFRFVYDGRVNVPNFFLSVSRKSLFENTSQGQFFRNIIPEIIGTIKESPTGTGIEVLIRNNTGSAAFLWFFHICGIALSIASTYFMIVNQQYGNWPMLLIGPIFVILPVLMTNESIKFYEIDIREDLTKYLKEREIEKSDR